LAHRWLGERDLSRGKFIRALRHFDDALSVIGPVDKQQVLARQMLAAAMLGRRSNTKVTHDVVYGRYTLTPDEFHQLIDEMVEQHAVARSNVSIGAVQVPKPARYEVRPWTVLGGDVGVNPQNVPATSKNHDWPARQMSTITTGKLMIVSNRYQVTAMRLKDGQVAWTYSLGKQQGQTHALPLRRLPLVLDADRVYAMLLPSSGRERLVCLDVSSGKLLWQLSLSSPLLSNPVAIDGQLFIVASSTDSRQQTQMFRLLELEPETGSVQHDVALSDFRQKKGSVPFIQIAVAGSDLLLAFEGGLACCDTTGELLWVRHTAWVPPTLRVGTQQHERQPPIVTEHSIYLATPGMSGIECLDVASGRRRWHQPITDPRRLLSVDSEQLLLETDHGIMALRIKDGQTAWRYAANDLLEVVTPADESKPLLCVGQYQVSQGESAPSLVWLDRRTGRRIAHHGLVDLRAATPRVGPIISRDGRTWCFAGTFDDKGVLLPQRQIVELVATEGEPTAPKRDRFSLWRSKVAASQSVASSDSDWLVLSSKADTKTGAQKEFSGRKNVLVTQAASSPVRLARLTKLPAESQMLVLEVCAESNETSHVVVRVGGLPAGQYTLAAGKPGAWQPLNVDLSAFAGREAWITIEHRPSGSSPAYAYWSKMFLEPLK
jgi:outer membrane protein assembly factor BamB